MMGNVLLSIGDIATVEIREAVEYTKINANGKEGILIAIIKQPNANLIELSDQMEDKLTELQKFSERRDIFSLIISRLIL